MTITEEMVEALKARMAKTCSGTIVVFDALHVKETLEKSLDTSFDVTALRSGDGPDGPVESHDLFLRGRGLALLINVPTGSRAFYSLIIDGKPTHTGTIGAEGE